ncbi:MAG: hypothetical protein WBB35_03205, partial [Saprospiraceae bacterium]
AMGRFSIAGSKKPLSRLFSGIDLLLHAVKSTVVIKRSAILLTGRTLLLYILIVLLVFNRTHLL